MSSDADKKLKLFYKKLKTDREWYFRNFLKIRDKSSKLVPLSVNSAQKIVLDKIKWCEENNVLKRFIILKARQMGISTLIEALIFHDTATNENKISMIIAHEDKATQNLFNMSKLYYEELPGVIQPMKKYSNERALVFENPTTDENEKRKNPGLRSKITVATANTLDTGRSGTYHNIHASEIAFFPDAQKTMLALLQGVPDDMNTLVVLESTANGVGGYFYDMWQQAMRGENDFIPIFLPWFTDPTYSRPFKSEVEREAFIAEVNSVTKDANGKEIHTIEYELRDKYGLTYEQLNWRRWCISNKCGGDEELFRQEYPSTPEEAFIASGRPKFNISALKKYATLTKKPKCGYIVPEGDGVKFVEDPKGYVRIWKEPQEGEFYCIGADVAEGLEIGDYSCAVVGDSNFDIVASWHGHIDPDLFGEELVKLGRYYNNAYLGVEANNHGLTTLKKIISLEYWDVYYQKTFDRITETITQKIGWHTNAKTKPLMIDKLAEFVREMYLGIYWDTLISEMFTYVIGENGSTNAQPGCYDDTVMACAILLQLLLEGRGEEYTPEIPFDERDEYKMQRRREKDVVDPLFEVESDIEVAE